MTDSEPRIGGQSKYYELSFLLRSTLSAEEASREEEEIRNLLGKHGAVFDSWDGIKLRRLPYQIQKLTEAYAGAIRFNVSLEHASEIRDTLKSNPNVLRALLLEWQKALPPRRIAKAPTEQEEQVPTDEKALDEKLEQIFGSQAPEPQHESQ